MLIKYSVKFFLENRTDRISGNKIIENIPINCDVTYKGKRLRYYLGYRIDFDKWNKNTAKVKSNCFNKIGVSGSEINKRIKKISTTIDDIFDFYKGIGRVPAVKELREELKIRLKENQPNNAGFFDKYNEYVENVDVSDSRRKQLRVTKEHFKRFCDSIKYKVTFEAVDVCLLNRFEKFLEHDEVPKGRNTRHSNMKRLSAFFNYAIKEKWTDFTPFKDYKFPGELYGTPIFLLKEELRHLANFSIKNEELSLVKDLFVLQSHLGARVGDFIKLTKSNVIGNAIKYIPEKTKNEKAKVLEVPLTSTAKQIIRKYNYPDGKLMPFIHPNDYNEKIKLVFRKAKLTRNVVKLNPLTEEPEIVSLASIVGTHTARRSFIGIMHKTQKNEVISSMTGHVPDSRAFQRYYDVDIDDKISALKKGGIE